MSAAPASRAEVTLGRRATARLLDAAGLGTIAVATGAPSGFGIGWFVATLTGVTAYFVVADATAGTTLGKRALGLAVVGPSGATATFGEAARREAFVIVGAVPFAGPVLALAAWVSIGVTARSDPAGRGWHDRLAGGTQVVASN